MDIQSIDVRVPTNASPHAVYEILRDGARRSITATRVFRDGR